MSQSPTSVSTSADPLGLRRVLDGDGRSGLLPQQAEKVDPALPLRDDELLIDVESLNVDSASFHQISEACGGDVARIERHVLDLVARRGKLHNPVTGSGGMLIGKVCQVGSRFPVTEKPVKEGDRIATLVSLSLTPLEIRRVKAVHPAVDRIDVEGHAILFPSGIFARLPSDIPQTVALAALDVAGAPAQTRKIVKHGDLVVVVGGGGKSGLLCLAEARRKKGVTTVAVDYSDASIERLRALRLADRIVQADARNAVDLQERVLTATGGRKADVVINVANVPGTEMACILCCRDEGVVYLFSMATSFQAAALGAEGVGADVDLRIGNGYTRGHADLVLDLLRESPDLMSLFKTLYG